MCAWHGSRSSPDDDAAWLKPPVARPLSTIVDIVRIAFNDPNLEWQGFNLDRDMPIIDKAVGYFKSMTSKAGEVAYSGGLDSSTIVKWLQVKLGAEVVTFTAEAARRLEEAHKLFDEVSKILTEMRRTMLGGGKDQRLRAVAIDQSRRLPEQRDQRHVGGVAEARVLLERREPQRGLVVGRGRGGDRRWADGGAARVAQHCDDVGVPDVGAALDKAIAIVDSGKPAVVDVITQPR